MKLQELKDWCRANRKELIVLSAVVVIATGIVVYLCTVEGGIYIIVQGRPFCIKYVGQTRNFHVRRWAHLCSGYYDPSRDWFARIPIPSVKDALEKFLINVIKPPLNKDYEVATKAFRGFVSSVNIVFSGMNTYLVAVRLWPKTDLKGEGTGEEGSDRSAA